MVTVTRIQAAMQSTWSYNGMGLMDDGIRSLVHVFQQWYADPIGRGFWYYDPDNGRSSIESGLVEGDREYEITIEYMNEAKTQWHVEVFWQGVSKFTRDVVGVGPCTQVRFYMQGVPYYYNEIETEGGVYRYDWDAAAELDTWDIEWGTPTVSGGLINGNFSMVWGLNVPVEAIRPIGIPSVEAFGLPKIIAPAPGVAGGQRPYVWQPGTSYA